MTSSRRGRRGFSPSRRGRARYAWTSTTLENFSLGSATSANIDALGAFTVIAKQDVGTVLRVIGTMTFRAAGAGSLVTGGVGMVRVTDDAMAAGALPDPLGDLSSSWLFNQRWSQEDAANVPVRYDVDVKSRRRLDGFGQTIALVLQSSSASVGSTLVNSSFRLLFQVK